MAEKQKRGEAMYQGAIKDKNAIMTQLVSKESEIGKYYYILNNLNNSPVLHAWLGVWNYHLFYRSIDAMHSYLAFPPFVCIGR